MSPSPLPQPLSSRKGEPLKGRAELPGDKSVSHRALILSALAVGESRIKGLLEADDVLRTAGAVGQLGAEVVREADGEWRVYGVGVGGLREPDDVLDFGNSGTGVRLMMGAIATTPITALFTGDASLRRRPMRRVLDPLARFGARWMGRTGGFLPLALTGSDEALPATHDLNVASAQVKSALLLAALNVPGHSTVIQHIQTRDHTERMLRGFGAKLEVTALPDGGEAIMIAGEAELHPVQMHVPRDPSAAAFPLVAALLVPGSEVSMSGVMLNPRRTGLFDTLREMGADIAITDVHEEGGETLGTLHGRFSSLKGIEVPAERAPAMIDEYPILAVAAAFAEGRTVLRGLEELRVKESDRLAAIAAGLRVCGVAVEELEDGLIIEGCGAEGVQGGGIIATHMDHRIAMSFLVLGLGAQKPVTVDDGTMIATSFPGFVPLMKNLGAAIAEDA
jgi:3-phosphoshikimate 1-carboxyvinyltransferase